LHLSRVLTQIELAQDEPKIRDHVEIAVSVDCSTGATLVPREKEVAVKLLDRALPLDFKAAILKGDYINPYRYGFYGASAIADLSDFFDKAWNLKHAEFCRTLNSSDPKNEQSTCFYKLLSALRDDYNSIREEKL